MPLFAGAVLDASGSRTDSTGQQARRLVFYLAGERFYNIVRSIGEGERVTVTREMLDGKVCYGVFSKCGQRMGYVPKGMIGMLEGRRIIDAHVISAREFGVPWRRHKIGLTTMMNS